MKRQDLAFLLYLLIVSVISASCSRTGEVNASGEKGVRGKISLSGAFALYPLAVQWGEEFKKIHPGVTFDIQGGGAGKGMTDAISGTVHLGMISRAITDEEIKRGAYSIAVAMDAVVATCNDQNPHRGIIEKTGVTREMFRAIWIEGKSDTWGDILGNQSADQLEIYTRSDAAGAPETWAKYLGARHEDLLGTGVFGDPGIAEVISKTRFAIGFNNVNYVYDGKSKKPFPGLMVVPIDLNGNGVLEESENFYSDIDQLNRAIEDGRFPLPPSRELFFVTKGKSNDILVKEFLNWALTDGQKFVKASGYVPLTDSVLIAQKKKVE